MLRVGLFLSIPLLQWWLREIFRLALVAQAPMGTVLVILMVPATPLTTTHMAIALTISMVLSVIRTMAMEALGMVTITTITGMVEIIGPIAIPTPTMAIGIGMAEITTMVVAGIAGTTTGTTIMIGTTVQGTMVIGTTIQGTIVIGTIVQGITAPSLNVKFVTKGVILLLCDWRNSKDQNGASSSNVECQICGKKGHIALDCGNRTNFAYQGQPPPASIIAMFSQGQQDHGSQAANAGNQGKQGNNSNGFSADDDWILDTGATHHMTADIGNLSISHPYHTSDKITVGSGEGLTIQIIGCSTIKPASHSLQLNNVLHVPRLAANLLSLNKLCSDNRCYVTLDDEFFCVQDKVTREVLFHGSSRKHLYKIPKRSLNLHLAAAFLGQKVKSSTWHHRLGHPTNEVVSKMLAFSNIPVLPSNSNNNLCTHCISGKMTRLPFSPSMSRSSVPFHL